MATGKGEDEGRASAAGLEVKKTPALSGSAIGTADSDYKEDLPPSLHRKS